MYRPLAAIVIKNLLLTVFLLLPQAATAAIILVGPNENITRIADAARVAKDGDTVLIMPGEYRGDVAVWTQKQLTIRGRGERPVLSPMEKARKVKLSGSFTMATS